MAGKRERQGLFSGKWLLLLTLGIALCVPLITIGTWWLVDWHLQQSEQRPEWENRHTWEGLPTTAQSFRRGLMSSARTGKTYEDFGFHLSAGTEDAIRRCVSLARLPRAEFTRPAVRDELEKIIGERPELFYAHYLLGTWHRLRDEPELAARQHKKALAHAGAVIIQPYRLTNDQAAAKRPVGSLAIALDRVQNDVLVQNLKLVYPHLRTDARGRVYLPVYHKTLYRMTDPAPTTQPRGKVESGWFTFPGRIGRRPTQSPPPKPETP